MNDPAPPKSVLELAVPVEVWLAEERVPLETLLELKPGGLLPLHRTADATVDLVVNGEPVASGELVIVDGRFGVKITTTTTQKIAAMESRAAGGSMS
jgi:flagellar motor switch protein FliN/FliY